MKNKTVLFVLLDQYADWECAYLMTALQGRVLDKTSPYEVKTVSTQKTIRSIGGLTVIADYLIDEAPSDYAGLVLVGGMAWRGEDAKRILPLAKDAYDRGIVLGAICDATVFLGMNGLLNEKKHTSNRLDDLSEAAGERYTGSSNYISEQAVRDGHLITANGTAALDFTKEVLTALDAYPADYIENNDKFYRLGFIEIMKLAESEQMP